MSPSGPSPVATDGGSIRSQLATAVVRLHAENYGRGPTRARAHLGDDHVILILEDVFTTAERTLVAAGAGDRVREFRSAYSDATRATFIAAVESITGRTVRAHLTQTSTTPEVAVELFLLEPAG